MVCSSGDQYPWTPRKIICIHAEYRRESTPLSGGESRECLLEGLGAAVAAKSERFDEEVAAKDAGLAADEAPLLISALLGDGCYPRTSALPAYGHLVVEYTRLAVLSRGVSFSAHGRIQRYFV